MKVPPVRELRRLNVTLRRGSDVLYRKLLRSVVAEWSAISKDESLEKAVRSWDVPKMLACADSLVAASHATAALHFAANQIAALIRKYPWTPQESKMDPELTALNAFLKSERTCGRTNRWFRSWHKRTSKVRPYAGYILRMQNWIRYVLGDAPDLQSVYDKCDFTSGASIGVHGDATNLGRKLLAESWSVSPTARPIFAAALCSNFHFAAKVAKSGNGVQSFYVSENDVAACCTTVNYNKVGFVPKTAKTHRVIAVEPLGNTYIQKGIDLVLRDRLRRVGLDLRMQEPNQRMAREGSFDDVNGFVTIDLSSASDSISTGLCRTLLPPEWFNFLNRVRSPSYRLPKSDVSVAYEKFVTMGNGFCFPLQTLLFSAIIKSIQPDARGGVDFRVYGDDIIVRKEISTAVILLLKRMGFRTNSRKTFVSGPFRESCGSNWYGGEDVTPMTLDWKLDSLENLFKFVNQARRNERCSSFFSDCAVFSLVLKEIPDQFLFYRPFKGRPETGIDPAGLEFTPQWRRHSAWQCHMWLELHTIPVEDRIATLPDAGWVVMAAALRGSSSSKPFTFRRRVETRVRRVASGAPEQRDYTGWAGEVQSDDERVRLEKPHAKLPRLNTARQPDLRNYRLLR